MTEVDVQVLRGEQDLLKLTWSKLFEGPDFWAGEELSGAYAAETDNVGYDAVDMSLGKVSVLRWGRSEAATSSVLLLGTINAGAIDDLANLVSSQELQAPNGERYDTRFHHGERMVQLCRRMLRERALSVRCPWTGKTLSSQTSIVFPSGPWNAPLYAYRFQGSKPFILIIGGFVQCEVHGLYFPGAEVVIAFGGTEAACRRFVQSVEELRILLLRERRELRTTFSLSDSMRDVAIVMHSSHFAHNLWNEVSAIEGIVSDLPDRAVVHVAHEPNGPLGKLFPELANVEVHRSKSTDIGHFFSEIRRTGAFFIPIGRVFIPLSTIRRVLNFAACEFESDVKFAKEIREAHQLVLWISVRADVRVWLNQAEELAYIIQTLISKYKSVAVVIDGYTPGYGQVVRNTSLQREREIVAKIVEIVTLPCTFISLVGSRLQQAYIWGAIVDLYVANHGTIQHKIAWMHKIEGVAHRAADPSFRTSQMLGLCASEGSVAPTYVFGIAMQNDGKASDPRTDLMSYKLGAVPLLDALERILPQVPTGSALAAPKRKVLNAITEDFYTRSAAARIIGEANASWAAKRWPEALRQFADAVIVAPRYRSGYEALLRFLLMTYVAWYDGEVSDSAALALAFTLETEPNNEWARAQLELLCGRRPGSKLAQLLADHYISKKE